MEEKKNMIVYGPIPSRRLGKSMGINNIPPKICTYSCIYCQLGRTLNMQFERKAFYKVEEIFKDVKNKVNLTLNKKEPIDYLTFVSDGEPTLDINLGKEIERAKSLGIKVAVITNSSLIWRDDVRDDLSKADWVSVKIDAISQDIWRRINRAHKFFKIEKILQGISKFSMTFKGELATETMIIKNVNNSKDEIKKISDFIKKLHPKKSYLSIPTRPPAEKWAEPADEIDINNTYQIFDERGINTELLTGYEGNAFAFTGEVKEDLLSIMSVHPMRKEGVKKFLSKAKTDWSIIEKLIKEGKLVEVDYRGNKFYIRKLSGK